jgi:hypothetical protein
MSLTASNLMSFSSGSSACMKILIFFDGNLALL